MKTCGGTKGQGKNVRNNSLYEPKRHVVPVNTPSMKICGWDKGGETESTALVGGARLGVPRKWPYMSICLRRN